MAKTQPHILIMTTFGKIPIISTRSALAKEARMHIKIMTQL